jgi:ribosomal protein S25
MIEMAEIETGAHKCPNVNGRMQAIYTDEVIINALRDICRDSPTNGRATPRQVAEKVGCNNVIARDKLKSLVKKGLIQGDNLTGRWIFWV